MLPKFYNFDKIIQFSQNRVTFTKIKLHNFHRISNEDKFGRILLCTIFHNIDKIPYLDEFSRIWENTIISIIFEFGQTLSVLIKFQSFDNLNGINEFWI